MAVLNLKILQNVYIMLLVNAKEQQDSLAPNYYTWSLPTNYDKRSLFQYIIFFNWLSGLSLLLYIQKSERMRVITGTTDHFELQFLCILHRNCSCFYELVIHPVCWRVTKLSHPLIHQHSRICITGFNDHSLILIIMMMIIQVLV